MVNEIERVGFDKSVRDVFFSVGKDGTLWKSGAGTPNWMKLIEELPDDGWTGGGVRGFYMTSKCRIKMIFVVFAD